MLLRPIQGDVALKFWSSSHICNRLRAICAYSEDKEDANNNLARFGYTNSFRKRVLESNSIVFNDPLMTGVPFNSGSVPLWECLQAPSGKTDYVWDDIKGWVDADDWND